MRKTYDVRFSYLNTNKASARYTVYETNKSRTLNTQISDPTSQQGGGNSGEHRDVRYDTCGRSDAPYA